MKKLLLSAAILVTTVAPSFAAMQSTFSTDSFENMTIHTYQSNDPMTDASFIIETEHKLVILEPQAFAANTDEMLNYVKDLNKPVDKVLVAFHSAGLDAYQEGDKVITKPMDDFMHSSAGKGMLAYFKEAFKGQMNVEVVPFDTIISPQSELKIDGVTYTFFPSSLPGVPGSNVDINGKALYQHFAPTAHSHPSPFHITSTEAIEGALADAHKAHGNGYGLFLGSHYPAKGKAVDLEFQIQYLNTIKDIANKSDSKIDFMTQMKASYPDLDGDDNLQGIADNFFKS